MKKDLVFILTDGDEVQAFGNLKTLLESIHAADKYSTVWRLLKAGGGSTEFGAFSIHREPVVRAPFTKQ